jgi:molybdopterin converting factor small subunit
MFHIPGALREFTAGNSRVQIEDSPPTLAEALSALWKLYPGVRDRIATEQGQVREHINIFIGDENVRYTGGLASPISANSEISIVPAVSGGCVALDSIPSTQGCSDGRDQNVFGAGIPTLRVQMTVMSAC